MTEKEVRIYEEALHEAELKKKGVYIAGPVSGLPREVAMARFKSLEDRLTQIGFTVVNPMRLTTESDNWAQAMGKLVPWQMKCRYTCMMENWIRSIGARIEMELAQGASKTLIFPDQLDYFRRNPEQIGL